MAKFSHSAPVSILFSIGEKLEISALQETMIAELKRYKQSVITEAVTGKLRVEPTNEARAKTKLVLGLPIEEEEKKRSFLKMKDESSPFSSFNLTKSVIFEYVTGKKEVLWELLIKTN